MIFPRPGKIIQEGLFPQALSQNHFSKAGKNHLGRSWQACRAWEALAGPAGCKGLPGPARACESLPGSLAGLASLPGFWKCSRHSSTWEALARPGKGLPVPAKACQSLREQAWQGLEAQPSNDFSRVGKTRKPRPWQALAALAGAGRPARVWKLSPQMIFPGSGKIIWEGPFPEA